MCLQMYIFLNNLLRFTLNYQRSYFSGYLQVLDDRWHFLSVKSFNCNVEVGLDLDIIKTQSTFVACGFKNFSTVTLTSGL